MVTKADLTTSGIIVPRGDTASRPTLSATDSVIRYNTDEGGLEEWNGTAWQNVSADITAIALKGTDTAANILLKTGMVAEDLWIASDTLDGYVYNGSTWINIGPLQGPQGTAGISAYQVAINNGFVGTEGQWLASLVGAQGIQGVVGNGVSTIVKTNTVGLVDTYTITFTDTTTTTFNVTNGLNGTNGVDGQDIDHVSKTAGTGAGGTIDTYTVWGDIGETINLGTFNVYNGVNGVGTVAGVTAGTNVTVDNTDPTNPIVGLGTNVTVQGNTFNGNSQLVQTTADGKLPALDGSLLTGIATGSEHYSQELTPTGMSIGATWYVPSTSKTYMYVNDGTNNIWIDTSPVNTGVTKEYVDTGLAGKVDVATTYTKVEVDAAIASVNTDIKQQAIAMAIALS